MPPCLYILELFPPTFWLTLGFLINRYGPPIVEKMSFTILDWAKDPANHQAWKKIQEREHLPFDPFEDIEGNFTFADTTFVTFGPLSMNKVSLVHTKEGLFRSAKQKPLAKRLGSKTGLDWIRGYHGKHIRDV